MGRLKSALLLLGAAILGLFLSVFLLSPYRKVAQSLGEHFTCHWEDGTTSDESDFSKINILSAERERIVVEKDGRGGYVRPCPEYVRAVETVEEGDAFHILSFALGECGRLERMALFLRFGETCVFADEPLCWDGRVFAPTERTKFQTVLFLEGELPNYFLADAGARELIIKSGAVFTAFDLEESKVSSVRAESPYLAEGGAIYLEVFGRTRLIAVLRGIEELDLDCDYLDPGVLRGCTSLKKITFRRQYKVTLADLFGDTSIPEGIEIYEEIL